MPFDVFLNKDKSYFQISDYGDMSLDDRLAAKSQCVEVCAIQKITKILIDTSAIVKDIDAVDYTKFAYTFSKSEFPENVKIALLIIEVARNINFAKMIISTMGINIRGFDEKEAALAWLHS